MTKLRLAIACVAVSTLVFGNASAKDASLDYLMGPQDMLKVRVYDWRVGTYDTHEWPALTGEFTVGAAGRVAFPIVGELAAEGKTTAELATAIANGLRDKVGLAQVPYAAVEIVKYRPFYILGAVAKPGDYPFRPSLTVVQAVGIAGGLERSNEAVLVGLEREAVSSRGEIHVLEAERRQLLARQTRIKAELNGDQTVPWPAELADQTSDAGWTRTMHDEEALFTNHVQATKMQEGSVTLAKQLLGQQLIALGAKGDVLNTQEELTQTELNMVSGLVARGLAGTPRQIALQQSQAQLRGNRIDLDLAVVHTKQDMIKSDRELSEFKTKNRTQLFSEESEVRLRLATIAEKERALRTLIDNAQARAPQLVASSEDSKLVTTYAVAREADGQLVFVPVPENYALQPGETVRIEQHRENSTFRQSSNP